ARGAQMRVGVEEHRHHGLAGEIDARGAGGHGAADLRNLAAAHDQRRVVEDATLAHDHPCAFVSGGALRVRPAGDGGKDAESDCCRQSSYFHSMHCYLPSTTECVLDKRTLPLLGDVGEARGPTRPEKEDGGALSL